MQKLANGKELTVDAFEKNGFNKPILFASKEGLGMVVPDKSFTVMDVERSVGMLFSCTFKLLSLDTSITWTVLLVSKIS